MMSAIGNEKLATGGGISTNFEEYATQSIWRMHGRILDFGCLISMLVGHLEGIVHEFVEIVGSNCFVADIDLPVELRKINIDPVRILWLIFKKKLVS